MTRLIRTSPTHSILRGRRDLDRPFGQLLAGFPADVSVWNDFARNFSPSLDVTETEEAFHLELDVPGVAKDDIEISLHEGILTIKATRNQREMGESESSVRKERYYGEFSRSLKLGSDVDPSKIDARLENGVLSVVLPKAEKIKPKTIKIH